MILSPQKGDYIDIHTHNSATGTSVFGILNVFLSDFPSVPVNIPISTGLHPWHAESANTHQIRKLLTEAASHSHVLAIGETGVDKLAKISPALQETIFRIHAETAEELKKPLIIHCVKAYNEILKIKKEMNPTISWIIHGYHGSDQLTRDLIRNGLLLSVNMWIMKFAEKSKKMFKEIPVHRLFLETDEYKTDIADLYRFTADCYYKEPEQFRTIISDNYYSVFKPLT